VRAIALVLAIGLSEAAQGNTTPSSRGPGSWGPYPKTRERMLEVQNSPSSSEQRRGPARPMKHGLPPIKGVSIWPPNRNPLVDPAPANAQNSEGQAIIESAGQTPLTATFSTHSDHIEERLFLALKGVLSGNTDLVTTGSNQVTIQPTGISAEPFERRPQNGHPGGQSIRRWRSSALFAPPAGVVTKRCALNTPHKEMAARKRLFVEIIDLTSDDIPVSVEDHPLTASKMRRLGDTNFQSADGYDGAQEPTTPNDYLEYQRSHLAATTTTIPIPKSPQSHLPTSSTLAVDSPVPNLYKDFEDIAKIIDRSVAFRKSRYDQKTIARDIS